MKTFDRAVACLALLLAPFAATAFDIAAPPGSVSFGHSVAALPNGNIVVTDPGFAGGIGAAYLYSASGTLLSTLTGTTPGDRVGERGVTLLANGNYVVRSPSWSNSGAASAGAVTFALAASGVAGQVSAANSLVGGTAGDGLGDQDVVALANGNYVVPAQDWSAPGAPFAGAATWGSGTAGVAGAVDAANSLVGGSANDQVGALVVPLANGNYVVASDSWDDGAKADVGEATWGDGAAGVRGVVSAANSLIGGSDGDSVGRDVVALRNGNYVVLAPHWHNGALADFGAVTWRSGTAATAGTVSAANSLIGAQSGDRIGSGGVVALSNGNYVVASPDWINGAAAAAGAATWRSGTAANPVTVGVANSLVGTTVNDRVASTITPLSNGHYVVCSPFWDDAGLPNAGAATWGDGNVGTTGPVAAANSLAGEKTGDYACGPSNSGPGVVALTNGNYVVISFAWNDGATIAVGAVTWRNGGAPHPGRVTKTDSLTGSVANDLVGNNGVAALANGNYVVRSRSWDDGAAVDAGAATWGSGTGPTIGALSSANSLVGTGSTGSASDPGILALPNGNYVVVSPSWNGGRGAATVGNGAQGASGSITAGNSLTGATAWDLVGNGSNAALPNGDFAIGSRNWDNGATADAGAVTVLSGAVPLAAASVGAVNSVLGTVTSGGPDIVYDWDAPRERLVVGLPAANRVTVRVDRVFRDGFE